MVKYLDKLGLYEGEIYTDCISEFSSSNFMEVLDHAIPGEYGQYKIDNPDPKKTFIKIGVSKDIILNGSIMDHFIGKSYQYIKDKAYLASNRIIYISGDKSEVYMEKLKFTFEKGLELNLVFDYSIMYNYNTIKIPRFVRCSIYNDCIFDTQVFEDMTDIVSLDSIIMKEDEYYPDIAVYGFNIINGMDHHLPISTLTFIGDSL